MKELPFDKLDEWFRKKRDEKETGSIPPGHRAKRPYFEAWQRTAMTEAHKVARAIGANAEETTALVTYALGLVTFAAD